MAEHPKRLQWTQGAQNGLWSQLISLDQAEVEKELIDFNLETRLGAYIYFLPKVSELRKNPTICATLSSKFHCPKFFWTDAGVEANGFYGSRDDPIHDVAVQSHASFSRFLMKEIHPELPPKEAYEWQYLAFCSLWRCGKRENSFGTYVLLCFDMSSRVQKAISDGLQETQGADLCGDPFTLQSKLTKVLVTLYDEALWTFRKPVRKIEQERPSIPIGDDEKRTKLIKRYEEMHELSRHIIHCSETLAVASKTMLRMIQDHKISVNRVLSSDIPAAEKGHTPPGTRITLRAEDIEKTLHFYANFLVCLELRAKAFEQRLTNEIKLAFNVIAADDSSTSKDILKETRDESKAFTFTVSLLTVLFLPGSFVSGFLGMNFFSYTVPNEQTGWHGTNQVGVFFAISLPITGICLVCWVYSKSIEVWMRKFSKESKETNVAGRHIFPFRTRLGGISTVVHHEQPAKAHTIRHPSRPTTFTSDNPSDPESQSTPNNRSINQSQSTHSEMIVVNQSV